jgi:protein involved in polysaccharide export with SLBB domain
MRRAVVPALALLLSACAPAAPDIAARGVVAGGVPLTPEHTLAPGDEIEIRFPFSPEFNERVAVGPDGTAVLKLAGPVLLGGSTVPEATARLKRHFAKIVRDPELSVTVRAYAPEAVYVDGWVARPGLVRSEVPLTVARAIARAGGMRKAAATGDILVIRRDADGKPHAYRAALGDFAGAGGGRDPLLNSFDIVYVPQTPIAAIGEFLAQYARNLPFSASYNVVPATPSLNPAIAPPVTAPH